MEKNEQTFEQAINRYSNVARVNQLAQQVSDLHDKIRLENKDVDPEIIFSRNLEMLVVGTDHSDRTTVKATLKKAEISYCAYYVSGRMFSTFYLSLRLISHNKTFIFDIAKSQNGYEDYQVCYKEDKFRLQGGDGSYVNFNSKEDLQLILDFCNKAIVKFNEKVSDDYKLVTHFKAFANN